MTTLDWRELLGRDDGLQRQEPCADADLAAAEIALAAQFPAQLRELYRVTDGVFDGPGQWFVVWPLRDVVDRNRSDWAVSGASGRLDLVGFGDDGAGAPFCVPRDGASGVFVWSAIDAVATRLANTLADFFTAWQSNSLPAY